jgi:DNA-binding transcriptional ArsR family regulator
VLRVLGGSSSEQVTETTEKIPMFWPGALGVLGGERQTEALRRTVTLVLPIQSGYAARVKPVRRGGDPFDALGDPHRRAIVELLRSGSRSVGEIADALPISRPAVSRHLRLLKRAGLVADAAEGTRRLYRLDDEGASAMRSFVESVWGHALMRYRLVAENTNPARVRPRSGRR